MKKESEIAVLKEQMRDTREDVRKIMDNHLPHIQAEIGAIKYHIAFWSGGLAILGVLLQIFKEIF